MLEKDVLLFVRRSLGLGSITTLLPRCILQSSIIPSLFVSPILFLYANDAIHPRLALSPPKKQNQVASQGGTILLLQLEEFDHRSSFL